MEPQKEAIRYGLARYESIVPAFERELTRNGIQARVTATNVRRTALHSAARVLKTEELLAGIARQAWFTPSINACTPPHTTNVQLAPCHRPPSSMTIARLAYRRTGPRRLPPSGMYR